MRWTACSLALGLFAIAVPVARADDLTGQSRFLCSAMQTSICYIDGECESGPAWSWDVPQFIEVDLDKKQLSTTKASGESRSSPIVNFKRDEGQIVLQGYENKRAFSFLIDEKTGWATVAIARREVAVTVFGACTPKVGGP